MMFAERRGTGDLQMLMSVGYPLEAQGGALESVDAEPDSGFVRHSVGDRKHEQL